MTIIGWEREIIFVQKGHNAWYKTMKKTKNVKKENYAMSCAVAESAASHL